MHLLERFGSGLAAGSSEIKVYGQASLTAIGT